MCRKIIMSISRELQQNFLFTLTFLIIKCYISIFKLYENKDTPKMYFKNVYKISSFIIIVQN